MKASAPVFKSAADPAPRVRSERPSREFERLVNEDLRDKFAAGPAYKVLSRPENRVAWLQALTGIRESINAQNAHDNALLAAHPDKPSGGPTPESYANAKREIEERKRRRSRAIQAVNERIGEAQRLIGIKSVEGRQLGVVVEGLLVAQSLVAEGRCDEASRKIAYLLRTLTGEEPS